MFREFYWKYCRSFTKDIEAGHSKWQSGDRTDETAFLNAREYVKALYPIFFCILVALFVCIFSIIHLDSKLPISGEYGGFKFRPLSIKMSLIICFNLHRNYSSFFQTISERCNLYESIFVFFFL